MKILYLSIQFSLPFQSDLAREMARRGHEVTFFSAGRFGFTRRPYLRWGRNQTDNIATVELVNSPNVPGTSGDPVSQTSNPVIERLTAQVLEQVKPDLVHVHELQGHSLSVLELIRARNIPSVVTMHNYWPICPQLYLLDVSGSLCRDYAEGEKCTKCHWLPFPQDRFWIDRYKSALMGTPFFKPISKLRKSLRRFKAKEILAVPKPPGWGNRRYQAGAFVIIRQQAVAALNQVSTIHTLSTRSKDVLAGYGVRPERMKTIPICPASFDALEASPPRDMTYPIIFGYRGNLSYVKGVHILIKAFAKLDQDRARLLIYGGAAPGNAASLRRSRPGIKCFVYGDLSPHGPVPSQRSD